MSHWEAAGQSDEWYTPAYIFDALGCVFETDAAAPRGGAPHVPARTWRAKGAEAPWEGFVWLNPPFGGRNGITPWADKFFAHGNGVLLTPDRTSAPWWQDAARKADAVLFIAGKVKFERPDGSVGKSPSTGTTLFAAGLRGEKALARAAVHGLGQTFKQVRARE